jgi:CDP-2,3-bis-(O-geranylgeranyl)-sn-glycerol synthase
MEIEIFILLIFAYVIPMYIANASPIFARGKKPIDFGKKFRGKRIFGKGKTIGGTISGIIFGTLAGLVFSIIFPQILLVIPNYRWLVLILAVGAMLGDIFESFAKRQIGIKSGALLPVFDQIDFILGGFILSLVIRIPEIEIVALVLFVTIFAHIISNRIGFEIGLKKVPW